jgi:exopolysaccharide production protein ExoZ
MGETFRSVQLLRGLAALAVVFAHLHAVERKLGGVAILGPWSQAGFAGVDLFFAISGFVMVWTTREAQGRAPAVPGFVFARLWRIYPLWWLVCGLVLAVWLVRPEWVYASHQANPDIVKSFLLLPQESLPLHAVGWTLIHELWFYLVFALLLFLPARFLPWALGVWAVLVVGASLEMPRPDNPWLALIRHPLTLAFIAGAGIGLAATRGLFPAPRQMLQFGLMWLILGAISVRTDPPAAFAGEWERVLKFGLPSALIIWGAVGLERAGSPFPDWGVRLGDWSYALYLIHVPAIVAVGRLAAPFATGPGFADNLPVLGLALAVALAAGMVLHEFVERPLLAAGRSIRGRFRTKR